MTPVRRAGQGLRPDASLVVWTLAEGRRGRRWREVVLDGEVVRHGLLYETGPDGRFTHLELASAAGLATLHPEPDGTLHGNAVDRDGGVRHVEGLVGAPTGLVVVEGSTVAAAATAWARPETSVGDLAVVLDPRTLQVAIRPLGPDDLVGVDADGAPALEEGSGEPLER